MVDSYPSPMRTAQSPDKKRPRKKIFDWISYPDENESITSFQQETLDVDWSKSRLGPMHLWPPQLCQMVLLIFADPFPAAIYWGEENTVVYNEAYTSVVGDHHPSLQGQDPKLYFPEAWPPFEGLLSTQRETGLAAAQDNQFLLFRRHGFLEEMCFSWKFMPVIGDEGYAVGCHTTGVENTRDAIESRRQSILKTLREEVASASTAQMMWKRAIQGLEHADKDIPLALVYSTGVPSNELISSSKSTTDESPASVTCVLEGSLGVSSGHRLAPAKFDLAAMPWLAASFRRGSELASPVLLQEEDGSLPTEHLDGIIWRGHKVRPLRMVVCPIKATNSQSMSAFVIMALNPRRPYDDDYQRFIHTITAHILTSRISVISFQEELLQREAITRQESLAREELSRELSARTLEVKDSELRFTSFAARVQIGLAIFDKTGSSLYGNKYWETITQLKVNCSIEE